ncbi:MULTISPECIES: response regulator transcription factor [Streptomycetaceae]|uniref:response regulator transcription factor n=1 Tax=Streptomycetaceae TaxID=2062 RepID=UPI00093A8E5E|nr:response regulator transcription factor [Streptomyces sp. CB02056]OKH97480.1 LuxR family transcriptional regulator [Streptomyces sp. CB02056]
MNVRVLLVDDEELLRLAFGMILRAEPDMEPVGEAADGAAAVELARRLRPDVVLMDVRMPGTDGIGATRRLLREVPGTRVLVLTTFDLEAYAVEALRAGACGFLLKNSRPEELLGAIRDVARGDAVVSPRVTRLLLDRFAHRLPAAGAGGGGGGDAERLRVLTAREREVLLGAARGLTNTELAAALGLAEPTVKKHLGRVMAKLGLRDRVQAVIFAYECGLVGPR